MRFPSRPVAAFCERRVAAAARESPTLSLGERDSAVTDRGYRTSKESTARRRERGALNADMIIALAIFVTAMLPLGYGWVQEQKVLRSHYWHAVAMEIVDGEMEILMAGEWRAWREGTHTFPIKADAAKNLPPGKFTLTRTGQTVRLEWVPEKRGSGGAVVREAVAR